MILEELSVFLCIIEIYVYNEYKVFSEKYFCVCMLYLRYFQKKIPLCM